MLGVWTYNLGVWTYILGVWTYIYVSGLISWVSGLILWVSGPAGGRAAGSGEWNIWWTNSFWEYVSWKNMILHILLNADFGVFLQKRRAPKNAAFWCAARAEISHMESIQARKLKLIIWIVSQFNFQMTAAAAAAASQELSTSGKTPGASRAGTKYPVQGNPSLRWWRRK